jgi:outer membrane receptor protein involved in Fe transport
MVSTRQAVAAILRSARSARVTGTAATLCLLATSLTVAPHAFAQQAPASNDQSSALEEITVTGSRIKRTTDYTTATPTTVTDATQMENLGVVNLGQMLEMTPSNVSQFTPQTSGNSAFYTGAYISDLRGLNGFFSGGRTLTMIDGNRVIATNTQDTFDLNFIPQILVQRLDTVTGGASAAYGSGAESGVVNVILDHQLEGGKLNADEYDTHYNDAKDKHVAAAYGHGLFNNRLHFVVAGEYESQDPASCQHSGRTWCNSDIGAYTNNKQIGTTLLFGIFPVPAYESVIGRGLTNNTSPTGVLSPNTYFNASSFSLSNLGQSTMQAAPDGQSLTAFQTNNPGFPASAPGGVPFVSAVGGSLPGGSGEPVNLYDNLTSATTRSLFSAMLTGKITDNIDANLDLNWGKVEAFNPGSELYGGTLAWNNPYLPAGIETSLPSAYQTLGGPVNQGYSVSSDLTSQVANNQTNDTTLKRAAVSLKGKIGSSSWSWDGYAEYGETNQVQGTPAAFTNVEASMALDAVKGPNGQIECRVTAAGSLANAYASATNQTTGGYGVGSLYPGSGTLPGYLTSYAGVAGAINNPSLLPINPLTGLNELQALNLLATNCQPLNILGNQGLANGVQGYSTGALGLTMDLKQKSFALNASGDLWKGVGAGPFSLAAGYEWRSVDLENNFNGCPDGTANATAAEQYCLARATDFTAQFGDPYGGTVSANEVYLELNTPLLKDLPFAHALEFDLAARESFYSNKAGDAVTIPSGTTSSYKLPTWKASMLYEPFAGLRFRASQSHDARAPDTRDLYYSQQLAFTCGNGNPAVTGIPSTNCIYNLIGNANLKPETTNTTTLGLVFSPPQLAGLQASADWFHIRLTNGINGGTGAINQPGNCYNTGSSVYCNDLVFTAYSYNAAGQACGSGVPGTVAPNGPSCAGLPVSSGVAAYRQGNVANILQVNEPAFNGAFYDERGVDFSVSYTAALPGGSIISARALATWVGEQTYQNYTGAQVFDLVGQTGNNTSAFGLGDYQTAARWRGNMSVTWSLGGFSLTPTMNFTGVGTLNNLGIEYNPNNPSTLATWYLTSFPDAALAGTPGAPADAAAQAAAKAQGLALLPANVANRVPAYFLFSLNGAYNFTNVPGLKGLQVFVTVNNLFNKSPPYTGGFTSNPVFFDTLGLSYRAGFRMTF